MAFAVAFLVDFSRILFGAPKGIFRARTSGRGRFFPSQDP